MIDALRPMLIGRTESKPWDREGWAHEIKQDGHRLMAQAGALGVQLRSRNMVNCSSYYPEICSALARVSSKGMVLDGEAVVQDSLGRSDFEKMQERAQRRRWVPELPVIYCVFDVLVNAGRLVIDQPLWKRKKLLERLRGLPNILLVDHLESDGITLFQSAVLPLGLEGLVSKRLDSLYYPGQRSVEWVRIRRPNAVPAQRFKRGGPRS